MLSFQLLLSQEIEAGGVLWFLFGASTREVRVPVPAGLPSPGTELESPSVGQPHLASRAWLARTLALVRGYCKRSHWEVTAGPSIFLAAY